MFRIRTTIAAAILAAGIVSMAPAAEPNPPAPPPPGAMHEGHDGHFSPQRLYEKLGLNADQKSRSDAVFAAKGPQLKSLHEQLRANMEKIHQITPDDPNYSATISQLAQTSGSLTTQLISAEGDLRAQLFAILTPAQKTQLAALEAKLREHMREHMSHMKGGKHWGHALPPPDAPVPLADAPQD